MRKYIRQIFSESAIYGFSGVITSFIGMFLMPIYTRVFEPKDYAVIALIGTTSTLISMLIIFGMDNSVALWYWDKPDTESRKKIISCWYFFMATLSLAAGSVFILFPSFFSRLILNTSLYTNLIILFGFNLLVVSFQKIASMWFRIRRKPILAVSYSLFISLLTIGLNLLFILKLKMGLEGIYYSQLIASGVGFLLTTVVLYKWLSVSNFDWSLLKQMLRFSLPLIPAALVYWLMSSASTYFINLYVTDKSEIGLYQVGSTIASVLGLATWAFLMAWPPFAFSIHKEANARNVYSLVFELYCVLGFFFAFCLALFAGEILQVFTTKDYAGAKDVIGLLAINTIVIGLPGILSIASNLVKQNAPYAYAVLVGSSFTVILFILLIPVLGKEGAGIAMLVGNTVVAIYLGYKVQKLYFIPYEFKRIFGLLVLEAIFFFLLWRFVGSYLLKIAGVIAVGVVILLIYQKMFGKNLFRSVVKT